MEHKMLPEERLDYIYQMIKQEKTVYVNDLASSLGISKSTARTDLAELEKRGLVLRTHGGAVFKAEAAGRTAPEMELDNLPLHTRMQQNMAEKQAIGKYAASLIAPGDTLMIDGGSTTQYVAPQLAEKQGLTIITNSFYMMQTLCKIPDAVIYLAGGMVYRDSASVVGEYANEFLSQFKVKKTILGIDGLSVEYGLTDADSREPQSLSIKKKMIQACDELIIVCDHSKIGRACLAPVEQLSRVSYLVTGEGVDPAYIKKIEEAGVRVLVAPFEK